jgi:NAD(P)-dependent dehydrogenase (short-subunit alcohol dehydrogenase family)
MAMRSLDKRVAVVTGAASGIGRATAQALAAKGCHLAIADIDETGLAQTARTITGLGLGRELSTHLVDVADKQRMQAFVDEVIAAHGRAHIVVNNAGVTTTAKLEEHSLEDFEWVVGINFWGVVYGCKFFLPHLQAAGWGAFVNISSLFGLTGVPKQSSYCATKFAVRGFSESLAIELANENIDVLSVHPGGIRTNIVRASRGSAGARQRTIEWFERNAMPPERAAAKIVTAIERRRQRVLITREAYVADLLKRLYPPVPRRIVSLIARRTKLMD